MCVFRIYRGSRHLLWGLASHDLPGVFLACHTHIRQLSCTWTEHILFGTIALIPSLCWCPTNNNKCRAATTTKKPNTMKLSIAALTLLVIASFTESVEDFEQNLRGISEIDDEEDGEDADLLDVRSADITDIFQLGKPTWGGSGCPSGTSKVVLSPADIPGQKGVSAMTVIFDAYFAKTSRDRSREYKSCSLALPVKVKPGFQVAIIKASFSKNAAFLCTRRAIVLL